MHDASAALAKALAGKRVRPPGRRREPKPHGVLVDVAEPMDPSDAALMSPVLGSLLPGILGEVWRRRAAGPRLTNTDGHRLRMITAKVTVNDPATVTRTLAAHADFQTEGDGGLSWWGRELTEGERAGALAQIHSLLGGDEPIEKADQPQRWLRGGSSRGRTASMYPSTPMSDWKPLLGCSTSSGPSPRSGDKR